MHRGAEYVNKNYKHRQERNMFDTMDKILMSVQKPVQYTGGELGMVVKNPGDVKIRFAFCFPDNYEIGMSHLGIKILYHLLNERTDTYCERVFAPWPDMEQKMREHNMPLFALETKSPVKDFDFIGYTLQYELSYTNVINMLDLAGVELLSSKRAEDAPFVCAGGPCAYNPEPLADFIDFFMMGEGEELINEVMDVYAEWKGSGKSRKEFLQMIAKLDGVYVPAFYDMSYNEDGTIQSIMPNDPHAKSTVTKRIVRDLDKSYFPETLVVPFAEVVHDRVTLEVFRGCIRGCRFCQAGHVYRPVREKTAKTLSEQAKKLIDSTGYEEISLCSLSTSDYSELPELTERLLENTQEKRVNLSLPSLRIDNFSMGLMQKVQAVRKSGITFAPEAGTQRLRDVICKGITEQNIVDSAAMIFGGGWTNIKLYFMIGLPTETMEDVLGISELAHKVRDVYFDIPKEQRKNSVNISVSASSFVPKPFTPFQWEPQDDMETLMEKQRTIRGSIKFRQISFSWHGAQTSYLEGVFARGDRRLGAVLLAAHKNGCKFDGWNEHFKFDMWQKSFEECGIDPAFYNLRRREFNEVLPWEHIDVGVSKAFLQRECELAYSEEVTPNCREECSNCGVAKFKGGLCVER